MLAGGVYAEQGVGSTHAAVRAEVVDFFVTRTKVMLRDAGVEADTIDAVLAAGVEEPVVSSASAPMRLRTPAPTTPRRSTTWPRPMRARTTCASPSWAAPWTKACSPSRNARWPRLWPRPKAPLPPRLTADSYAAAPSEPWRPCARPSTRFFDDVMVMDEDPALRDNRLRLLNRFVAVFANVADFGKMAKSK